jgi:hypothetical protein
MKKERRQSTREESDVKVSILFKNREVGADLRNISAGGVFLTVAKKDNDKIASADIGQVVTFRMVNGKSNVNYNGTIGRYTETEDNKKYLAIYFSQRTMHESL